MPKSFKPGLKQQSQAERTARRSSYAYKRAWGRGWRDKQVKLEKALTVVIIPQNRPGGLLNFGALKETLVEHAHILTLAEAVVFTDEWQGYQHIIRAHATVCHGQKGGRDDDGDSA